MNSVADFHTHILPNMDDGSSSVECSLQMLRRESEQGVNRVVLTPHFYANHDSPKRFLERRTHAEAKLRKALAQYSDLPQLFLGAEVHYFEGMSDSEYLRGMAIQGTNYVLVEMPMSRWTDRMLSELEGIYQKCRLVPIVAHADRYVTPFRAVGLFRQLAELPVMVQVNANFFLNPFSRNTALKLLSQGQVHLLGSDCHDMAKRPPNLSDAIRIINRSLGEPAIAYINSQENKIIPVTE